MSHPRLSEPSRRPLGGVAVFLSQQSSPRPGVASPLYPRVPGKFLAD